MMISCSGELGAKLAALVGLLHPLSRFRRVGVLSGLGVPAVTWVMQPFLAFPRLLEQGIHSDVVFVVHGKPFRAHRCILGARSTYFANMLDTKWKGKSVVVLRHPLVRPSALGERASFWESS